MKVLIVGSGAREHAIVRALMRDENVTGIECAPGNAGIAGDVTTLPLDVTDTQAIAALALERGIDLVVIGPGGAAGRRCSRRCSRGGNRLLWTVRAGGSIRRQQGVRQGSHG